VYDPTLENLVDLQPDVYACTVYLVNAYREAGYPAVIVSGRRTWDRQQELIAEGLTTATYSHHLTGRAVDLAFLGVPNAPWEWFAAGGALWKSMGGRWGGDFSTPDLGHFDGG
jgi:hypothetical protein